MRIHTYRTLSNWLPPTLPHLSLISNCFPFARAYLLGRYLHKLDETRRRSGRDGGIRVPRIASCVGSSKFTGSSGCLLFTLLFTALCPMKPLTYCARRRDGSPSHLLIYDCLFGCFAPYFYWPRSNGPTVNTLCLQLRARRPVVSSCITDSLCTSWISHRHLRGNPKVLFSIGGCLCNKVSKAPRLPVRLVDDSTITLFYCCVHSSFWEIICASEIRAIGLDRHLSPGVEWIVLEILTGILTMTSSRLPALGVSSNQRYCIILRIFHPGLPWMKDPDFDDIPRSRAIYPRKPIFDRVISLHTW